MEYYRGMQQSPRNGLVTPGTMTTEELHSLQGKDGEYYRGMQQGPRDGLVTAGTMTTQELQALQGENGEYYRAGRVADSNEYRLETTGTTTEKLSQIVTELSQLNFVKPDVVSQKLNMLKNNTLALQKILEYRIAKTFDALYGYGNYNKDAIKCDLMILNELVNNDYNINNKKINVAILIGEENFLTISELLQKYKEGLIEKRNYGYDISLDNNSNSLESSDLINVVDAIKEMNDQKNNIVYQNNEENVRKYSSF